MKKHIKTLAALGVAAVLTGCASLGFVEGVNPESYAQRVLAAESDYYAAFVGMATYEGLPRCDNVDAPDICSEQSVVDAMRLVDNRYIEARDLAWDIVRTVDPDAGAFENAMAVMTTVVDDAVRIVSNLKKEGLI